MTALVAWQHIGFQLCSYLGKLAALALFLVVDITEQQIVVNGHEHTRWAQCGSTRLVTYVVVSMATTAAHTRHHFVTHG